MIKLENVNFDFSGKNIFTNVNLEISQGKLIGIVGDNGSGKSTLAKLILGLLKPKKGQISTNNLKFGYLSQSGMNIDLRNPIKVIEYIKINDLKINDELKELFKKFSIDNLLEDQIKNLSGGQKQKVLIAVEMLKKVDFLILDEPTSALDNKSRQLVSHEIKRYGQLYNTTTLMISHDNISIDKHCDKVMKIENNNIKYMETKDYLEQQIKIMMECDEC